MSQATRPSASSVATRVEAQGASALNMCDERMTAMIASQTGATIRLFRFVAYENYSIKYIRTYLMLTGVHNTTELPETFDEFHASRPDWTDQAIRPPRLFPTSSGSANSRKSFLLLTNPCSNISASIQKSLGDVPTQDRHHRRRTGRLHARPTLAPGVDPRDDI